MAQRKLDVVEKIDGFVEEPEAGEAGGGQQRQQESGGHMQGVRKGEKCVLVACYNRWP